MLREHIEEKMSQENNKLTEYVENVTSKTQAERLNLADKYDRKLNKIKDICAQYFSKYEKHLMN